MRRPHSSDIIKIHQSASDQLIQIKKPNSGKYLTLKFNPKPNCSIFFRPYLNSPRSEIIINKNYEMVEKHTIKEQSSDSELIPTPQTPKNPQEDLAKSLMKLKSVHWNEAVSALRNIIQISRFHPHLLTKSMPVIYKGIISMLRSLRITAERTACQAANELFMNMPSDQGVGFDNLVNALLQKAADSNKNLRKDALEALDSMVIHVPPAQSIKALLHRRIASDNLNVRVAASKLLTCVLADSEINSGVTVDEETKTKLVFASVKFLQDPNFDIKFHGMRLFTLLMEQKDFQNIFRTKITNDTLQHMLHIIETIKSSKRHSNICI